MNLIDQLKACGKAVGDQLAYINLGGCGVYAANIAQVLEDKGITVWGVISSTMREEDLNVIRANDRPVTLREWNNVGIWVGHMLVQFEHDGKIWTHDSRHTTCKKLKYEPTYNELLLPGYLTVPEMVSMASCVKGWNTDFDRKLGIPIIKKTIKKYLSRL